MRVELVLCKIIHSEHLLRVDQRGKRLWPVGCESATSDITAQDRKSSSSNENVGRIWLCFGIGHK